MRWVLAGLAFALLIGLAVFTVAIKARNLEARARIALVNQHIVSLRVERARREQHQFASVGKAKLIQRLHGLLRRVPRQRM